MAVNSQANPFIMTDEEKLMAAMNEQLERIDEDKKYDSLTEEDKAVFDLSCQMEGSQFIINEKDEYRSVTLMQIKSFDRDFFYKHYVPVFLRDAFSISRCTYKEFHNIENAIPLKGGRLPEGWHEISKTMYRALKDALTSSHKNMYKSMKQVYDGFSEQRADQ